MHSLLNFLHLAQISPQFLKAYFDYRRSLSNKGPYADFWAKMCQELPDLARVSPTLRSRMRHYLFANRLTSIWFTILRGKALDEEEALAGRLLGLATPLADYLVDEEQMEVDQIRKLVAGHSHHPMTNLVQGLYHISRSHHPNTKIFDLYLEKTQLAQDASRVQLQNPTQNNSRQIMSDKGGYALLLYRSALKHVISDAEENAIYQLGALMQLHNDVFDVYRDSEQNIVTLATCGQSITDLRMLYNELSETTFKAMWETEFKTFRIKKFLVLLNLILQTGHLALEQYVGLQPADVPFLPKNHERHELVCDMDDPAKIYQVVVRTLKSPLFPDR